MKEINTCPACNAMFESGISVCPNCGFDISEIKEQGSKTPIKKMKIFDGVNYTLALDNNKLYGFGNNQNRQISNESVSEYKKFHFIADNVISAAASRDYSVYITENGEVKIQGKGELAKHFAGFSGAAKVFATQDDQFIIITNNGEFYVFGNNINGQIKEKSTETVYCKYNIPFCHREDKTYSITTPYPYEKDKNSSWTNDDIIRLKTQYFSSRICGDEVYQKYEEFISSGEKYNIKWDISLDISSRECNEYYGDPEIFDYYNDGTAYNRYYYVEYKGESSVVAHITNNYIFKPIPLDRQKAYELLGPLMKDSCPEIQYENKFNGIRLFSSERTLLILCDGKLYGLGSNSCGQISDDDIDLYTEPHLISENVISVDICTTYSAYVTADGNVHLQGYGKLVDRFKGFANARRVYIEKKASGTSKERFYIVDKVGLVYGFGENYDNELQNTFSKKLLETKYDIILRANYLCYSEYTAEHYGCTGRLEYTHLHSSSYEPKWEGYIEKAYREDTNYHNLYGYFCEKYGHENVYSESSFCHQKKVDVDYSDETNAQCLDEEHEERYSKEYFKKHSFHNNKYADFYIECRNWIYVKNNCIYNPILLVGRGAERAARIIEDSHSRTEQNGEAWLENGFLGFYSYRGIHAVATDDRTLCFSNPQKDCLKGVAKIKDRVDNAWEKIKYPESKTLPYKIVLPNGDNNE